VKSESETESEEESPLEYWRAYLKAPDPGPAGIPGQGVETPKTKFFNSHSVLTVRVNNELLLLDPSYGNHYSTDSGKIEDLLELWEADSVAYYQYFIYVRTHNNTRSPIPQIPWEIKEKDQRSGTMETFDRRIPSIFVPADFPGAAKSSSSAHLNKADTIRKLFSQAHISRDPVSTLREMHLRLFPAWPPLLAQQRFQCP